jgi:hypothetical protein
MRQFKEIVNDRNTFVRCETEAQHTELNEWSGERLCPWHGGVWYSVKGTYILDEEWAKCNSYTYLLFNEALVEEWKPVTGERVLVRDNDNTPWQERIFLVEVPQCETPFICVGVGEEDLFIRGEIVGFTEWEQIKPLPQKHQTVSMDEALTILKQHFGGEFTVEIRS